MQTQAFAVGMRVEARDEVWVVSEVQATGTEDRWRLTVTGVSPLVRDQRAVLFSGLENVTPQLPEHTTLVADDSPAFRRSRLYWEAVLRATPLPQTQRALATVGRHLIDDLPYQREPARMALVGLRPRLLIADAVGLGKTLEIGLLLSELIRRGRGERILVVTPRHILEQFQHELWTRFALPLVRLDSLGIQRVRRRIPVGRNPFTYYKRAIISIDTLKSSQYRHALANIEWDAVVIDESHNLVNVGSKNNELARLLAPRTHALILASATPHNGRKESFGELISLLDPTAIPDTEQYESGQLAGLYVRRHKTSPDVEAAIGDQWRSRRAPRFVYARASEAEEAVFEELYGTWIAPGDGRSAPVTGRGARLFPYTLLKAYLSSPAALAETVAKRFGTLEDNRKAGRQTPQEQKPEIEALERLRDLLERVLSGEVAKFRELVRELREMGVGAGSGQRVVVFSERRATLDFLHRLLPEALGFPAAPAGKWTQGPVRQLHGELTDIEQQKNVKDFGLASSELRVLLTGDIAAEGVNLHRECHLLVHYDVPWSLITLEQRNGRIDRYGQLRHPETRIMLSMRRDEANTQDADFQVSRRLAEREDEVHRTFGDAAAVMGLHDEFGEERRVAEAYLEGRDLAEVVPAEPMDDMEWFLAGGGLDTAEDAPGAQSAAGAAPGEAVGLYRESRLFPDTRAFVEAAFDEIYDSDPQQAVGFRYAEDEPRLLLFRPDPDLQRRLNVLPQGYLRDHGVLEQVRATFSKTLAKDRLELARKRSGAPLDDEEPGELDEGGRGAAARKRDRGESSGWPDVTYLSDQHPVTEWLVDKALARLARNEAPIVVCAVDEPTVLVQGMYSNAYGRPAVLAYLAVTGDGRIVERDAVDLLRRLGVGEGLRNRQFRYDPKDFEYLIRPAVDAAKLEMLRLRQMEDDALMEPLRQYEERLNAWEASRNRKAEQLALVSRQVAEKQRTQKTASSLSNIITALAPSGEPMIRVLGVLVPTSAVDASADAAAGA